MSLLWRWRSTKFRLCLSFFYYVCLFGFVWIFSSKNFSLNWRRYRCLWRTANFDLRSLSSEDSLACHICHTRDPFLMVGSEDPWHSHLMPSVWQDLSRLEFEFPTFRLQGERSKPLRHLFDLSFYGEHPSCHLGYVTWHWLIYLPNLICKVTADTCVHCSSSMLMIPCVATHFEKLPHF